MTALIGILGALIGALAGSLATYLTARSNMQLELEHSYDRSLRDKRLERYQELFHISGCIPRYWRRNEQPNGRDLLQFIENFSAWYFGEEAGGMFLTPGAKFAYLRMMNELAEIAHQFTADGAIDLPLPSDKTKALRNLASELRHQLAEDVGAANPPSLRSTRPGSTVQPPSIVDGELSAIARRGTTS